MAVVFMDGFDSYNGTGAAPTGVQARWTGAPASLVAGRFGTGQAATYTAGSAASTSPLFTGVASFTCGFGVFLTSFNDTVRAFSFLSGVTVHVALRFNIDGSITALRDTTVLGSSAAGVLLASTWHTVECEVVISDTVGRVTIYVDGASVLNLTAQDTRNGATTTVDTFSRVNVGPAMRLDDLYITDSATKPTAALRIETLYPTSDGATLNWTPSTGVSHFGVVDEAQASTTDYISASLVGDVDELNMGDLSATPTAIEAVALVLYALKTDATARTLFPGVKSGATTSDGTAVALSTTGGRFDRIMAVDPNTAAAWTAAAVNALIARPKVAS